MDQDRFTQELLALIEETRRLAETIDDPAISGRLAEIADDLLDLARTDDRGGATQSAGWTNH